MEPDASLQNTERSRVPSFTSNSSSLAAHPFLRPFIMGQVNAKVNLSLPINFQNSSSSVLPQSMPLPTSTPTPSNQQHKHTLPQKNEQQSSLHTVASMAPQMTAKTVPPSSSRWQLLSDEWHNPLPTASTLPRARGLVRKLSSKARLRGPNTMHGELQGQHARSVSVDVQALEALVPAKDSRPQIVFKTPSAYQPPSSTSLRERVSQQSLSLPVPPLGPSKTTRAATFAATYTASQADNSQHHSSGHVALSESSSHPSCRPSSTAAPDMKFSACSSVRSARRAEREWRAKVAALSIPSQDNTLPVQARSPRGPVPPPRRTPHRRAISTFARFDDGITSPTPSPETVTPPHNSVSIQVTNSPRQAKSFVTQSSPEWTCRQGITGSSISMQSRRECESPACSLVFEVPRRRQPSVPQSVCSWYCDTAGNRISTRPYSISLVPDRASELGDVFENQGGGQPATTSNQAGMAVSSISQPTQILSFQPSPETVGPERHGRTGSPLQPQAILPLSLDQVGGTDDQVYYSQIPAAAERNPHRTATLALSSNCQWQPDSRVIAARSSVPDLKAVVLVPRSSTCPVSPSSPVTRGPAHLLSIPRKVNRPGISSPCAEPIGSVSQQPFQVQQQPQTPRKRVQKDDNGDHDKGQKEDAATTFSPTTAYIISTASVDKLWTGQIRMGSTTPGRATTHPYAITGSPGSFPPSPPSKTSLSNDCLHPHSVAMNHAEVEGDGEELLVSPSTSASLASPATMGNPFLVPLASVSPIPMSAVSTASGGTAAAAVVVSSTPTAVHVNRRHDRLQSGSTANDIIIPAAPTTHSHRTAILGYERSKTLGTRHTLRGLDLTPGMDCGRRPSKSGLSMTDLERWLADTAENTVMSQPEEYA